MAGSGDVIPVHGHVQRTGRGVHLQPFGLRWDLRTVGGGHGTSPGQGQGKDGVENEKQRPEGVESQEPQSLHRARATRPVDRIPREKSTSAPDLGTKRFPGCEGVRSSPAGATQLQCRPTSSQAALERHRHGGASSRRRCESRLSARKRCPICHHCQDGATAPLKLSPKGRFRQPSPQHHMSAHRLAHETVYSINDYEMQSLRAQRIPHANAE